MPINGTVDQISALDSKRIDGKKHDGSDFVEAHAELEYALSKILGVPIGVDIPASSSIFGSVGGAESGPARTGHWTRVRFSTSSAQSGPAGSSGIQFSDGGATRRLVIVNGTIQLWQLVSGSWEQIVDFEDTVLTAMTQLEDVSIRAENLSLPASQGLAVGWSGSKWILKSDTVQGGAKNFRDLTDVKQDVILTLAPPGTVWKSTGSQLVPDYLPETGANVASFKKNGVMMEPGVGAVITSPTTYKGASGISWPNGTRAELEIPGHYRISVEWVLASGGSHEGMNAPPPDKYSVHSYMYIMIPSPTSTFRTWPPNNQSCEIPWAYYLSAPDIFNPVLGPAVTVGAGSHGGRATWIAQAKDSDTLVGVSMYHTMRASGIFNIAIGIERLS